jgi:uncharacterized Zn finger protein (UPF0148 family)
MKNLTEGNKCRSIKTRKIRCKKCKKLVFFGSDHIGNINCPYCGYTMKNVEKIPDVETYNEAFNNYCRMTIGRS